VRSRPWRKDQVEIVREARIVLDPPGRNDRICGIGTLTDIDLVASKLLANADRWRDDSVFSRGAIAARQVKTSSRDGERSRFPALGFHASNIWVPIYPDSASRE
jgi:hypothetical protein